MKLTKERKKAYIYLILNAIIWGAALQIVKNSYEVTTPFRFLTYRYLIAMVAIIPIIVKSINEFKHLKLKQIFQIFAIEFIGTVISLTFLYLGLSMTTSIEASLVSMTGPILTIIGGVIVFHEKEQKNELIGFFVSLIGTLLIILEPVFIRNESLSISFKGSLLIFGANISNAIYLLLTKKYYQKVSLKITSILSYILGFICFLIISLMQANSINKLVDLFKYDLSSIDVIFAGIYMGIFGSILAMNLYLKGQKLIEVSEAILFSYLQPIVFIPLGVLWLKEDISTLQITSLILILTGVIYASIRPKHKKT